MGYIGRGAFEDRRAESGGLSSGIRGVNTWLILAIL